jgi:DNA modification methylase
MSNVRIINGHVVDVLKTLPARSVHCVVTSPPYYGLRDYDLPPTIWGGDPRCEHDWRGIVKPAKNGSYDGMHGETRNDKAATRVPHSSSFCAKCDAWRGQLGL